MHAIRVILLRRKHKVGIGSGGVPELEQMSRVFGNFIEYAPMGLVLLLALEFVAAPRWFIHLCGMPLLLGRTLHSLGLSRSTLASKERVYGMILTFASLLIASIGVLIFSFMAPRF
jgi:uncharacterized membrane protein YecN with MAPEG domain